MAATGAADLLAVGVAGLAAGWVSARAALAGSAGFGEAATRGGSCALAVGFFAAGGLLSVTVAAFARCFTATFSSLATPGRVPADCVSFALASFALPLDVVPPVPRLVTADVVAAFMLDTSYPSL
ncbi:MAG: hypothetical protein J0H14_16365 [Alphaproteobacteria bacterium]|nr:hypothetical protein [Alphaproteobacteria bacterium]